MYPNAFSANFYFKTKVTKARFSRKNIFALPFWLLPALLLDKTMTAK